MIFFVVAIARAERVSVLPRGGGTSQCGQTVNASLVVDCSRYLDRILEIDVAGRRCAGVVKSAVNTLWDECESCHATGKVGPLPCRECAGFGWRLYA